MKRLASHGQTAVVLVAVSLGLALTSCARADAPNNPRTLRMCGSPEMMPLLNELTLSYSEYQSDSNWLMMEGNSHRCLDMLGNGEVDIAALSSEKLPEDLALGGLKVTPFALDATAIVVHPSNPIRDVTLIQLQSIYAGRLINWQDLGGDPGEIEVLYREDGSGTSFEFERQVMGGVPATLTAVVLPSDAAVVAYTARHPRAIGFVSTSSLQNGLQQSIEETYGINVLLVEGEYPASDTVRGGSYHLTYPLYLATLDETDSELASWVSYVLSPPVQSIIERRLSRAQ